MSLPTAKAAAPGSTETDMGTLLYDTKISDLNFRAALVFAGKGDHIKEITLSLQDAAELPFDACAKQLQKVQSIVATRYGPPDVPPTDTVFSKEHHQMESEYAFTNGGKIRVVMIYRTVRGGMIRFDCAVGVNYSPGDVRAPATF